MQVKANEAMQMNKCKCTIANATLKPKGRRSPAQEPRGLKL